MLNNIHFLSPQLVDILKKFNDTNANLISMKTAKDNSLVPVYNNKPLHSLYYPTKEHSKYTSPEPDSQVIAIGLGALYHLTEIAKNKKIIAIVDPPAIMTTILAHIDLNTYFNDENLIICTLDEVVSYFDFITYSKIDLVLNHIISEIIGLDLQIIIQTLKNKINPLLLEYNTQRTFGKKWLHNSLHNLLRLQDFNYSPLEINSKLILVCGAGPSLDLTINEIIKYRKDIFLAATDTAYPILISHGIQPDCIFTMDSSVFSANHFINHKNSIRLFADYTVNVNYLDNVTLLFSSYPLVHSLLNLESSLKLNTSPGNIGSVMVDYFLKNTSNKIPVVSTGIDFAYFGYKSYSAHSYLNSYNIYKSSYFMTIENIDTSIYYKFPLSSHVTNWKTNSLLTAYSKYPLKNSYTLSNSPYNVSEKISNFAEYISSLKNCSIRIEFDINNNKFDFNKLKNINDKEINTIFFSYILHRRKNNCCNELKNVILSTIKKVQKTNKI